MSYSKKNVSCAAGEFLVQSVQLVASKLPDKTAVCDMALAVMFKGIERFGQGNESNTGDCCVLDQFLLRCVLFIPILFWFSLYDRTCYIAYGLNGNRIDQISSTLMYQRLKYCTMVVD